MTTSLGAYIIKLPSKLVKEREECMNREEILAKSRKDYEKNDDLMIEVLSKAGKKSSEVGLIITAIIVIVDAFFYNRYNFGVQAIYFAIEATRFITKYKYFEDKKNLTFGIVLGLGAVLFIIAHFKSLSK